MCKETHGPDKICWLKVVLVLQCKELVCSNQNWHWQATSIIEKAQASRKVACSSYTTWHWMRLVSPQPSLTPTSKDDDDLPSFVYVNMQCGGEFPLLFLVRCNPLPMKKLTWHLVWDITKGIYMRTDLGHENHCKSSNLYEGSILMTAGPWCTFRRPRPLPAPTACLTFVVCLTLWSKAEDTFLFTVTRIYWYLEMDDTLLMLFKAEGCFFFRLCIRAGMQDLFHSAF